MNRRTVSSKFPFPHLLDLDPNENSGRGEISSQSNLKSQVRFKNSPPKNNLNASLKKLMECNQRYVANKLQHPNIDQDRKSSVVESQNPFAVILSCADSRVIPELIFDCGIGDLFVIRIAGNIAAKSAIASIEFAVAQLNTNLVVILGHENCGAVTAAIQDTQQPQHLSRLLEDIKLVVSISPDNCIEKITKLNAINSNN